MWMNFKLVFLRTMGGTQSKLDCSEETRRKDEKRYEKDLGVQKTIIGLLRDEQKTIVEKKDEDIRLLRDEQKTIVEKKDEDIRLLRDGHNKLCGRLGDEKNKRMELVKLHGEEVVKLQNLHKEDIDEWRKVVHIVKSQHEHLGVEGMQLGNEMNVGMDALIDKISILGNVQEVSFTIKGMIDSIREEIIRLEKGSDNITDSMEKKAIEKQKHRIRFLINRLLSGGDNYVEYELNSMKETSRDLKWKIDNTLASVKGIDSKMIERAQAVLNSALAVAEELYTQIGIFKGDMAVKPSDASLGATRECLLVLNSAVHGVPKMAKNFQESLMEEKKEAEIKSLEAQNRFSNAIATSKATILANETPSSYCPIEKP